jgi:HD superfamily phosphohydrolase
MTNIQGKRYKKIKDPIYGYIAIDVDYIKRIIDTPVFQRLRRITQTSYAPLYSSALHNRFVHSLGVYHLGTIVSDCLGKSVEGVYNFENKYKIIENLTHVFLLACLLHDVGHAPFSHTGEVFYKFYWEEKDKDKEVKYGASKLHERLRDLVGTSAFEHDLPGDIGSTAPHEIMSAIIGIKEFGVIIGDSSDKEFFARCITGYRYQSDELIDNIKNCYIGMLNSKVIDVDRLDYLIRDAYTSGFETVNIDYVRLLKAITIKEYMDKPTLVYRKDAVSVIENVVYAHDAEKKWIQNHPVVLYETYIIKRILDNIEEKLGFEKTRLFTENSLSVQGNELKDNIRICMLCDDDIIYLCKNKFADELGMEFFDRSKRRHPVWKSEAEYKAYVSDKLSKEDLQLLDNCLKSFIAFNNPEYPVSTVINDEALRKCEEDYSRVSKNYNSSTKAMIRRINVCRYLKEYAEENHFEFDYLVLPTSMFLSNFSKDDLGKTLINFEGRGSLPLQEVCNILNAEYNKENNDMYYLYYRRNNNPAIGSGKIDDIKAFCDGLVKASQKENLQ